MNDDICGGIFDNPCNTPCTTPPIRLSGCSNNPAPPPPLEHLTHLTFLPVGPYRFAKIEFTVKTFLCCFTCSDRFEMPVNMTGKSLATKLLQLCDTDW